MFDKIKDKLAKQEEIKKEKDRLKKELIEQEKKKLLSLSEKELLVELIFAVKTIEKKQEDLIEKVEDLNTAIWSKQ